MSNPNPASKHFPKFKEELPSSVEGKVFVITGTTSGTGFVAARTVVEKGGVAVCLNRKSQRVTDSTAKLQEAIGEDSKGKIVNIECDLQDFASVQQAAQQIQSQYGAEGIYCLACNAGIMMTADQATKDGCDTQMQTNHLSHFLLTQALWPLLEAHANQHGDARVVFHSSGAREMTANNKLEKEYLEKKGGNLGGDKPGFFGKGGPINRYSQSKLANSVMMYALDEKLKAKDSKVRVVACHPGGSATNLGDGLELPWYENILFKYVLGKFLVQSAEDGTMGLLIGMMAQDAQSGVLYGPKNGMSGLAVPNPPKPYETDPQAKKMLWETSEETTGIKFTIL